MSDRVRIGTCSGLADAALVRSVFSAHGLYVVVGSENHAGVFTALGGGFISLDIWVDENEKEEAVALLRDLRERGSSESDWDGQDSDGDGQDGDRTDAAATADAADDDDDDAVDHWNVRGGARQGLAAARDSDRDDEGPREFRERIDRRRGTAIALLLGCFLTFGAAHAFTRAWIRFAMLAGIEIAGFMYLADGNAAGWFVILGAVAADLIGAVWRVQTAPRSFLPTALLDTRPHDR